MGVQGVHSKKPEQHNKMSFFSGLFGGGSAPPPKPQAPSSDQQIKNNRQEMDLLEKRQHVMQVKADQERANAQRLAQLMKKDKRKKNEALQAMKKYKLLQKNCDTIQAQRFNLEQLTMALETAIQSREVVDATAATGRALSREAAQMDAVDVEDMMDEVNESVQNIEEVGEALSAPMGFGADIDEDDLLGELDELCEEDNEAERAAYDAELFGPGQVPAVRQQPVPVMPTVPQPVPVMPTVPTPAAPVETGEDEFARLEASMAI